MSGRDVPRDGDGLRDVSDTALWVAMYRAEESARSDALFQDPYARRLAGDRGAALLDRMPSGRRYAWPIVVRTLLIDRWILGRIEAGVDVVVNLAAGLDARPHRLPLPATLAWFEVDLPRMIERKGALLAGAPTACRLERIALDLGDRDERRRLLADLARRGSRALVLTEGLLIYLERADVAALAIDLAAEPTLRDWITDLASPGLLRFLARTWGTEVARANAPFRFAPEEGPAFFGPLGWSPREVRSALHYAAPVRRLPWPLRLASLLPEPNRFRPASVWSGICRFERV